MQNHLNLLYREEEIEYLEEVYVPHNIMGHQ